MKRAAAYGTTVMAGALCVACWYTQNDDGKPAGVFSCSEIEETASGTKVVFCTETLGFTRGQAKGQVAVCNGETAGTGEWTFANAPCTHDGAIGGCRWKSSGAQYVVNTDWFYLDAYPPWPADAGFLDAGVDNGYLLCGNYMYISP